MTERVAHEVDRGRFTRERLGTLLGHDHSDRVEHHRRRARELAIHGQFLAVRKRHTANLRRDDLDVGACTRGGLAHGFDRGAIGTVRDQDADRAALQRVLHLADDLQRRRKRHIDDRRGCLGCRRQRVHRKAVGDALCERLVDMTQVSDDGLAHMQGADLRQLERERCSDVRLFWPGLAAEEQPRLAVVIGERLRAHPATCAVLADRCAAETRCGVLARRSRVERAGFVVHAPLRHLHLHVPVALLVGEWTFGRVDRQLVEVRRAQTRKLRVEIREQATLQQRIVGEVDARYQMRRAERDLLGLGEKIVRPAIQYHAADQGQRHEFFGNQLGRVQVIERECGGLFLGEQLPREFPLRKLPGLDRLKKVAPMEILIGAGQLYGLVPQRRLQTQLRPPVKLHECGFAVRIEQAEAVDAEAFHHAQRTRNPAIGHSPHNCMHRLRRQRDKIPERIVRRGRLRKAAVRLHLHRMDQIGKLDRVLDEEHRDIVAYQVPVAFLGVELHREAAHIARRVDRTSPTGHGRKTREQRCLLTDLGQDIRRGVLAQRMRQLEIAVRG